MGKKTPTGVLSQAMLESEGREPAPYERAERNKEGVIKYTGSLDHRKKLPQNDEERQELLIDHIEMLRDLLVFYGQNTKDPDWMTLAYQLALEHVPGFKFAKPAGRPKGATRWTNKEKQILVTAVEYVCQMFPNFTASDACDRLVKMRLYSDNSRSLYTRYQEAKKNQQ